MSTKLHEAVKKAQGVGLPIIPFAEGKVPGTGLSIAVSEYMQGVSNPQMPKEACPRCRHETCPPDCDCKEPDCPGKMKEQTACPGCGHTTCPPDCPCDAANCSGRANGRMIGGIAHEVTEGTVVEIDGDKITVWKDNDPPADKVKEGITKVQKLLRGGGVEEATKELNSGLGKWLERAREAKKVGNDKLADFIMASIQKVIADKGLDERTVYNWTQTFEGALAPEYSRSDFKGHIRI